MKNILILAVLILVPMLSYSMSKKQTAAGPAQESIDERVWVAKSNQAKSCENGEGISLTAMVNELQKNGIQTFEQKVIHDENLRMMMCGADKGELNAYLINKAHLDKAIALGFTVMPATH